MFITINLSCPRKILTSGIDNILLQAKIRGYTTKKFSSLILPIVNSSLISKNTSLKVLENKNGYISDFLNSLVFPLAEIYIYRKEIKIFMNYTAAKLKEPK